MLVPPHTRTGAPRRLHSPPRTPHGSLRRGAAGPSPGPTQRRRGAHRAARSGSPGAARAPPRRARRRRRAARSRRRASSRHADARGRRGRHERRRRRRRRGRAGAAAPARGGSRRRKHSPSPRAPVQHTRAHGEAAGRRVGRRSKSAADDRRLRDQPPPALPPPARSSATSIGRVDVDRYLPRGRGHRQTSVTAGACGDEVARARRCGSLRRSCGSGLGQHAYAMRCDAVSAGRHRRG